MRRPLWKRTVRKIPSKKLQTWIIPFKKASRWSRRSPSFILAHNKPSVHKLQLQLDNWITCWKINCGRLLLHFTYHADWTAASSAEADSVKCLFFKWKSKRKTDVWSCIMSNFVFFCKRYINVSVFSLFFLQESTSERLNWPKHNKLHYVDVLEKMKTRYCQGKREKIGFRMSGPEFILPCSAIKCSIIWK